MMNMMAIFEYALSFFITTKKGKWAADLILHIYAGEKELKDPDFTKSLTCK